MSKENRLHLPFPGRSPFMLPSRRPQWHDVAVLIVGYVLLDWASYLHPLHGLNITPWNPAPALVLVYLLRFGKWMLVPTVVAIVVAETWVRGLPITVPITLALAAMLAAGYTTIAIALSRFLNPGSLLSDTRSLMLWASIVGIGTLGNSAVFVGTLHLAGYVPADGVATAIFQYWVGDGAGVLVAMPLLGMLTDPSHRSQLRAIVAQRQITAYLAVALVALAFAFGFDETDAPKYLYVLFLPAAWAAARHGLAGAVLAAATIQVGIIAAVHWLEIGMLTVVEIQVLAGAIALFGFFIGIVVDEKQRVSAELRQTLRLAAAGEMAGALAHELNQPLTALSAYGGACDELLGRGDGGPLLREAVQGMIRESFRAAEVLRRLRGFFQTGTTRLEEIHIESLVDAAVKAVTARAHREGVALSVAALPACRLLGDRLQLEVVLRNLLGNALDAVSASPADAREVRVDARVDADSQLCIEIRDSGPGLAQARIDGLFEPFRSTKTTGMGLGLVISQAIAEAHGGSLVAEAGDHGLFRLTLPIEEHPDDAT